MCLDLVSFLYHSITASDEYDVEIRKAILAAVIKRMLFVQKGAFEKTVPLYDIVTMYGRGIGPCVDLYGNVVQMQIRKICFIKSADHSFVHIRKVLKGVLFSLNYF